MLAELFELIVSVVIIVSIGLILYARWNYGILESLNIPVVNRTFIFGSTPDLHDKVQHFEDIERFKKFGSIYGVYEGRKPIVYICDPELIRLILIKDFEYFQDRREIDLGHPLVNEMLDFLPFQKWKEVRGSMSPIVTTGKLKMMSSAMADSIVDFCSTIKTDVNEFGRDGRLKIDIRQKLDGLFIDLICRSAFGIKVDNPMDPNNTFVNLFKDLMGGQDDFNFMYTLTMVFPFLTRLAPTLQSDSASKIASTIKSVMDERIKSGQKKNDFVDVLNGMMEKLSSSDYKRLGISETTVLAQSINFVLAGYDAMCTTVTMLLYYLSKNPDIQEKVLDEIDSFLEANDDKIIFEKLHDLPYLHACISEAARLCPAFIRPERICTKDWEYNGIKIKKGLLVMIPAWAVHRSPEHFPDPDLFNPDRFLPENKKNMNPYAFMTFGQGPRNCVGMKYAYEAMKFSLCHIMRDYRFELCSETNINFKRGVLFLVMYDPIYLNIIKRKN